MSILECFTIPVNVNNNYKRYEECYNTHYIAEDFLNFAVLCESKILSRTTKILQFSRSKNKLCHHPRMRLRHRRSDIYNIELTK